MLKRPKGYIPPTEEEAKSIRAEMRTLAENVLANPDAEEGLKAHAKKILADIEAIERKATS
jgi:hypothetical protein